MTLACRPVADADLPLICTFPRNEDELFFLFPKAVFPLDEQQLRQAIAERSDSTVATLDGRPAAFANFYLWDHGGVCTIGNVMVDPAMREQGVGRFLIRTMIDIACGVHDAASIQVSCFGGNDAALLLYGDLGFHPFAVDERLDHHGRRVALIHLRLRRREADKQSRQPWVARANRAP